MTRSIRPLSALLLLILFAAFDSAATTRRRAVRVSAPACGYTLVREHEDPVGDAGMTRGVVRVQPSAGAPAECRSWVSRSPVDWITIEQGSGTPPAALITVAPNTSEAVRSATVTIAGVAHEIVQLGRPAIADPNLLVNAKFHVDLANWTWRADYPNSTGSASWSSFDANGSISSGSIMMRDSLVRETDGNIRSFQRLQCVRIEPSRVYEYGGAIRLSGPASRGGAAIAIFEYESTDCSGPFTANHKTNVVYATVPESWERHKFPLMRAGPDAHTWAFIIVSAVSSSTEPPFDVWFDDLFLRLVH